MTCLLDDIAFTRRLTRIALPADSGYLFKLGVALYGFASINSFVTEIVCYLQPSMSRSEMLSCMTSGQVLDAFRQATKQCELADVRALAKRAADGFERLNTERSDFVHAYPITNSASQQNLHRRVDGKRKYLEVTDEFLDDFISRLHVVSGDLYDIRAIVRPEL